MMKTAKEIIEKSVLKIQKTFPKNIDKIHGVSTSNSRLIAKLKERKEYRHYASQIDYLRNFESRVRQIGNPNFIKLKGITYQMNEFGKYDNLRESCLDANRLSSRLRFSLEIINDLFSKSKDVYLTEHDTQYYHYLKKNYDFSLTSSLFNATHPLHQDMTELSYPDESFDLCLSFEDLEHIPEYKKALKQLYRITRKGGAVLLSTPFLVEEDRTIVRAIMNSNGEITHLLEPEYHGDPLQEGGILSFYDFGWELLNDFQQAGFSETNLIVGYDTNKLILGTQMFISATK